MDGEARPFPFLFELRSGKSRWLGRWVGVWALRVWIEKGWVRRLIGVVGEVLGDGTSCEEVVSSVRKVLEGRSSVVDDMVRSNDKTKKKNKSEKESEEQ